jgi:hypothetical protein
MKSIFSLLLITASALGVDSQVSKTATVKQINTYVRSIDKMIDRRAEPDLVIADVSDYETDKPEWQKFGSTKELDAFREKNETYTVAYNWRTKGKIVFSGLTVFSPSGDWAQYVNHYFRSDGTAAKVRTEMRSFNCDCIIIRERFFGIRGKLLKKMAKYLDLQTRKPKKPTAGMLDENSPFYKADFYLKVSALPFYPLTRSNI